MKNLEKGGFIMKKQNNFEFVAIGSPSVSALSESEQKHFYITLLTRILELIKDKKQNEEV